MQDLLAYFNKLSSRQENLFITQHKSKGGELRSVKAKAKVIVIKIGEKRYLINTRADITAT